MTVVATVVLGAVACGVLERFAEPPRENRPETWLQVSGGNASKEGMTADLEAISEAGFAGVHFFHESFRDPPVWPGVTNPIPCLSEQWEDFVGHTARECRRLGLGFIMQGCPGWSMAGGPWIPDDKTMRELVVAEQTLPGGTANPVLPRPQKASDAPWRDYRDIAVVAFPTPVGDIRTPHMPVSVRGGTQTFDARTIRVCAGDPVVVLPPDGVAKSAENWRRIFNGEEVKAGFTNENGVAEAEIAFGRPVVVRTLELPPVESFSHLQSFSPDVTVRLWAHEASGRRLVLERALPQATWQDTKPLSLALPTVTAQVFTVAFHHRHPMLLSNVRFYSGARPDNWESESARTLRQLMDGGDVPLDAGTAVRSSDVRILTDRLRPDGSLDWAVPSGGDWTLLRIGHVNSGLRNHPAPPEATGWECDKLSTKGVDAHYDGYLGKLSRPGATLGGGLLRGILMDSWECEAQNWTDGLDGTFAQRRGYALDTWWPALFGYVVDSRRQTSLFYRDWRELLGELVFENFYGRLAERAHANGQVLTYETCGCDVFPADPLQHWKYADVPMCEFWTPRAPCGTGSIDYKPVRPCVSAARIYGKRRVAAEALTQTYRTWETEYPRAWKAQLDRYFALGITHMVFENYTHNPQVGFLKPGASFADVISTMLLRGQTWWKDMGEVTRYLARCSYLLESGKSTSDILLYLGDRVDHKPPHDLPFPRGFSYDYLNRDALLSRFSVTTSGLWTTPEGVTWSALWLFDERDLRPEAVERLAAAERQGAKVLRGDIFAAVRKLGLQPQVIAPENLLWQHRRTEAEEIYFLAEDLGRPFKGIVRLQGVGEAFFADPVTGDVRTLAGVAYEDGYAVVPLELTASGAGFVVIRRGTPKPTSAEADMSCVRKLTGEWRLDFEPGWGIEAPILTRTLKPWCELATTREGAAYAGTVRYTLDFTAADEDVAARTVRLDLGRVETSARVRLNGHPLGLRWTGPYAFDVSSVLRKGRNRLEIDVTSPWYNRLVHDAGLAEPERKTWTLGWPSANAQLMNSGLLGPVRLTASEKVP